MTVPLDPALARVAAALPALARSQGTPAVARLLRQMDDWQAAAVVTAVAVAAHQGELNRVTGRETPRDLHSRFVLLRRAGRPVPERVRRGEREYQRLAKRAQAARRTEEARESA